MIKAEFGIIDKLDPDREYAAYTPEIYRCVAIDDEVYIDNWWSRLLEMKTYFHSLKRPARGLARWGVTLIPPESLRAFYDIVSQDGNRHTDENLAALAALIRQALDEGKFMIHFGI